MVTSTIPRSAFADGNSRANRPAGLTVAARQRRAPLHAYDRSRQLARCSWASDSNASQPVAIGFGSPLEAPAGEYRLIVESRFGVANAPDQVELVQLLVDFPPGSSTSLHIHGGQAINLVLEGEIILRQDGVDRLHRTGQAWTDSTGQAHAALNAGIRKARLLTTFLLPEGAVQTTAFDTPRLEPTIVHEARFPLPKLASGVEIEHKVARVPHGWRAERTYEHFASSLVLEGEIAYATGTARKLLTAGEAWSPPERRLIVEENTSGRAAQLATTRLVPVNR